MSGILNSAVIIAPAHDELDRRVLRTVEAYDCAGVRPLLFLEQERITQGFNSASQNQIRLYKRIPLHRLIFGNPGASNSELLTRIKNADIIHVHDSGIYGLFLSKSIRSLNKKCKLVFDYHDWIEWEVPYQLSKLIRNIGLVKGVSSVILNIIYAYFRKLKLDVLVGISQGQLSNIVKKLEIENTVKTLVVPNTRPASTQEICISNNSQESSTNLIWVGNLGAGRSIEKSFEYIFSKLENFYFANEIKFFSIGKRWGGFSNQLEGKITHLGGYSCDDDIIRKAPVGKNIGLFFGWDDQWATGINSIASPNKLYTYIFLEWPFLIPDTLDDFIISSKLPDVFVYKDFDDFVLKLNYIESNYSACSSMVKDIKCGIKFDDYCLLSITKIISCLLD